VAGISRRSRSARLDGVIRSFIALGDSFTEGLEDELGPAGRHRGWADRVAVALAHDQGSLRYANLAIRGRLLDQVVAEQLPVALDLAPDLVSFHAGPNDVLRPRADLPALLSRYDDAVAALAAAGIRTVLFTVVERTGTGRTAERLAARFRAFNAGVRATAARHGAVLVDLAAVPVLRDRRLWHADRLHLAPEGHARVAAAVLDALGVEHSQWWRTELPGSPRATRLAALVADAQWVRVHLLPWIGRRIRGVSSGDGIAAKHGELVDIIPD
jgi:lysophospholipase L1-like esterase